MPISFDYLIYMNLGSEATVKYLIGHGAIAIKSKKM